MGKNFISFASQGITMLWIVGISLIIMNTRTLQITYKVYKLIKNSSTNLSNVENTPAFVLPISAF